MGPLHRTENKRAKLFQSVSKRCFGLKKLCPTYYCWTDPAEASRLLSGDEDVCVKVVMLAKIKKCDSTRRSLLWLLGRGGWRVNGGSAATVSPPNVSSWKPGAGGNFPAVPAAPGLDHISHNAQNPAPPHPVQALSPSPALHQSVHSSLSFAFFSHPLSFPPLFLPSGDTPSHWAEPVPLDLCCSTTSCAGSGGWSLA